MKPKTPIYGLMVEFLTAQEILAATRRARQAGYRQMDAYTPYRSRAWPPNWACGRPASPLSC